MTNSDNYNKIFNPSGCISSKGLDLYLNEKLSETQKDQIQLHLKECPFCRDALEVLQKSSHRHSFQGTVKRINSRFYHQYNQGFSRFRRAERHARPSNPLIFFILIVLIFFLFLIFRGLLNQ